MHSKKKKKVQEEISQEISETDASTKSIEYKKQISRFTPTLRKWKETIKSMNTSKLPINYGTPVEFCKFLN